VRQIFWKETVAIRKAASAGRPFNECLQKAYLGAAVVVSAAFLVFLEVFFVVVFLVVLVLVVVVALVSVLAAGVAAGAAA
jgi:hypothetical protein